MGIVIGVFGFLGAGKTTVSRHIANEYCFYWIDADRIGHTCLEDPSIFQKLLTVFGTGILQKNRSISRERLSDIVYYDIALKNQLECILWPIMTEKIIRLIDQNTNVVLDAALLFTIGWNRLCDYTVYVETSETARKRNLAEKSYSDGKIQAILTSQAEMIMQREKADYLIQNNGSIESLTKSIAEMMADIKK